MFSSRAAGFSRELWWFCMCFCIVLVLAAVYGIVFLQCLHIVFVLSVTLSPFLISTGKPKCCHTHYLNVAGGSSILISPSRSIMLTSELTTRQLSPRREISSRFNLARSRKTRSRHTPTPKYLKLLTCFQMCPFRVMLHAGLSFFFVMTIVFIFVVLILRPTASLSLSMMSIFTPRSHVILFYIESNQRSLTILEGRMYA